MNVYTICGPMCSGKSAKIIELVQEFTKSGEKFVCLKPAIDSRIINGRSSENEIISRNNTHTKALNLEVVFDAKELFRKYQHLNNILFDEVNFFNIESIRETIELFKEEKINLYFAGLNKNFLGEDFETTAFTTKISKSVTVLTARCSQKPCSEKATHSSKTNGDKTKIIDIGGDEKYEPMCEKHWKDNLSK